MSRADFKKTTLPRVPGRDFFGIVTSTGRRVWGSAPDFGITRDGSHAEYAVVAEQALSVAPANLTPEQAAAVGVPFTTAWAALIRCAELQPGEIVVIIGAGGAVGQAATQIANWKGARVVGVTRGAEPAPGAIAVIDSLQGSLREHVFPVTEGKGAHVVFDTVGGPMFEPALQCLRKGGRQVAISSAGSPQVCFNLMDFYHNLSRLIGFDSFSFTAEDVTAILDELRGGFETGALTPPQVKTVPLINAIDAYGTVASGHAGTKFVLTN